jgi:hypothetical protein
MTTKKKCSAEACENLSFFFLENEGFDHSVTGFTNYPHLTFQATGVR